MSVSKLFALLALCSVEVLAEPAGGLVGDLLHTVSVARDASLGAPTYPTTPGSYPTSTPPGSTTTVTVTVPATTTVSVTTTVTASCTPTPTLSCDKYGYLIQNVTLFQVDLATGKYSTVKERVDNQSINSIGYNTKDNLLYGARSDNKLIRIGADGTAGVVATLSDGGNVGDIDTDGYYWHGTGGSTWNQVDLRPNSATYGKLIANGTMSTLGLDIKDWAYIPVGGRYLYSAALNTTRGGTTLIRFSLDTKKWEVVQQYPNVGGTLGAWGAVYGINNGTLYASYNRNGEIWAFPVNGGKAYFASQGPASGLNDGARCVLNLEV
ncbi:hypothetical protein F4861DRAFT_445948 [Xylaria intraflava]|nr:hypothetical protein F4861DRAFT_445948 [Xylaria intraflava]